jgi:hypothetical protein
VYAIPARELPGLISRDDAAVVPAAAA